MTSPNSTAGYLIQQLAFDERQGQDSNGRSNGLVCFRELEETDYRVGLDNVDPHADYRQRVPELQRSLYDALTPRGYVARQGRYWIPVTTSRANLDSPSPEQCAELTAIAPLRRNANGALAPLRNGWLYVFVNGRLWREIYCRGKSRRFNERDYYQFERFEEVNLATKQGSDVRAPSALLDKAALVVPTSLPDDSAPQVHLAFSEVQWTWEYLCRLGGMSADDPRVIPEVYQRYEGIEVDAVMQQERLQLLELADFPTAVANAAEDLVIPIDKAFESDEGVGLLHHLGQRNYVSQNHKNLLDSGIPAVVIHDPLGEAKDWAVQLHDTVEKFAGWASQNAHPHTVAQYATQLIDENPDYAEQVRYGAIEEFMERYEREKSEFQEQQARYTDALLECLQRVEAPNSVLSVFSDYQLNDAHESPRYRHVGEKGAECWAFLTEMLSDSHNGFQFLRQQLEDEESITNQCLRVFDNPQLENISRPDQQANEEYHYQAVQRRSDWRNQVKNTVKLTDLGYKALERLLGTLARPVSEAKEHWERLSPRLEKLYGVRITTKELSYSEWRDLNRSTPTSSSTVISVAAPDAKTASHRVKILTFDDQPVAAHRALESLKGLPTQILNIAQVVNLAINWEELAKNGLDTQVNKLALLESSLSTIALVYDVSSHSKNRLSQAVGASRALRIGMGAVGVVGNIVGAMKDLEEARLYEEQEEFGRARALQTSSAGSVMLASSGVLFLLSATPLAVVAFAVGAILVVTGIVDIEREMLGPYEYWLRFGYFGKYRYGGGIEVNEKSDVLLSDSRSWRVEPRKELLALYDLLFGFEADLSFSDVSKRDGIGRSAPKVFVGRTIYLTLRMWNFDPQVNDVEVYIEAGILGGENSERRVFQNLEGRNEVIVYGSDSRDSGKLTFQVPSKNVDKSFNYALVRVKRKISGLGGAVIPDDEGLVVCVLSGNDSRVKKNHLGQDVAF